MKQINAHANYNEMINGHTRLCAGHSNCSHQMSKFYVQVQKSVLDLLLRLMANTAFSTIIVFKLLKQTHRCWASSFHNKKRYMLLQTESRNWCTSKWLISCWYWDTKQKQLNAQPENPKPTTIEQIQMTMLMMTLH